MAPDRPRTALSMLDDSHRRHDERLALLQGAAEQVAGGTARAVELEEITDAVAFFSRSVPNHFADEDEVVFPAIARAHPEHAAAVAALTAEHAALLAQHGALRAEVAGWNDALPGEDAATRFVALAHALAERHRDHAVREDALFAQVQVPDEDGALLAAMQARRGGGRGRGGGGGGGGGGHGRG